MITVGINTNVIKRHLKCPITPTCVPAALTSPSKEQHFRQIRKVPETQEDAAYCLSHETSSNAHFSQNTDKVCLICNNGCIWVTAGRFSDSEPRGARKLRLNSTLVLRSGTEEQARFTGPRNSITYKQKVQKLNVVC